MKKNISLPIFIFSFLIGLGFLNNVNAQIYVPASIPESLLTGFQFDLNSAVIDYSPNCTGSCGSAQLKVVSWEGNSVGGTIPAGFIADDGLGSPVTVNLGLGTGYADVVVGNNTSMTTDYLVGIVYTGTGALHLDIYDIANVGTSSPLTATLVSSQIISPAGYLYGEPHIDIIAQYGSLLSGLPTCDKFVITYTSSIVNNPTSIIGYYSSLNNPTSFSSRTIATSYIHDYYVGPDVAAIQRSGEIGIDDVALFTYMGIDTLFYQEWNITQGTISNQIILDHIPQLFAPRIDAIDDYHINNPIGANPLAYYDVVASNRTTKTIMCYNNKLPIPGGLDISSAYLGTSNITGDPNVAAGPCKTYTVAYPQYYYGTGDALAQSIDWNTGYPVNYVSGTFPFTYVDYYQINYSFPVEGTFGVGGFTASATCNGASSSYSPYALFAWVGIDGTTSGNIYDKLTDCSMAFKPSSVATVNQGNWSIAPNPAIDVVTLGSDNNTQGNTYNITDVTGRTLQHAAVTSPKQQIDVSALVPGMYILTVYSSNTELIKTIKLVKE